VSLLAAGCAAVVLSPVEWDFTWQSAQTIARGLHAHGWRVVFVEPLPKRIPTAREWRRTLYRLKGQRRGESEAGQPRPPGVHIVSPVILPEVHRLTVAANRCLMLARLARAIHSLISSATRLVVISFLPLPAANSLIDLLDADLVVYACQTLHAQDPLARRAVLEEERLFRRADFVLADSPYLFEHASARHGHVLHWPPMVDLRQFKPSTHCSGRLPLCAYFGEIGKRIDTELLALISGRFPLRLVGPVGRQELRLAPSAEVRGMVSHEELAAHLQDVDVLLLPYRVDKFTRAILPAKLFECFALGKPVVATRLPSLTPFERLVDLAESHSEFLDLVDRAPHEDSARSAARVRLARSYDVGLWTEKLSQVLLNWLGGLRELNWPEPYWSQVLDV
jgi:glycosyltransferase involved in cell wall biosynthesis